MRLLYTKLVPVGERSTSADVGVRSPKRCAVLWAAALTSLVLPPAGGRAGDTGAVDPRAARAVVEAVLRSGYNSAYLHSAEVRYEVSKEFFNPDPAATPANRVIRDKYRTRALVAHIGADLLVLHDNVPPQNVPPQTVNAARSLDRRSSTLVKVVRDKGDAVSMQYDAGISTCLSGSGFRPVSPNPFLAGRICGRLPVAILEAQGLSKYGGDLSTHLSASAAEAVIAAVAKQIPGYRLSVADKAAHPAPGTPQHPLVVRGYATEGAAESLIHEFHIREWDDFTCSYVAYYRGGKPTEEHSSSEFTHAGESGVSSPRRYEHKLYSPAGTPAQFLVCSVSGDEWKFNQPTDAAEFNFKLPAATFVRNDPIRPRADLPGDAEVGPAGLTVSLADDLAGFKDLANMPAPTPPPRRSLPASRSRIQLVYGAVAAAAAIAIAWFWRRPGRGRAAAAAVLMSTPATWGCRSDESPQPVDASAAVLANPAAVDLGNVRSSAAVVPVRIQIVNPTREQIDITEVITGCGCMPVDQAYKRHLEPSESAELVAHLRVGGRNGKVATAVVVNHSLGQITVPVFANVVSDLWCDSQPVVATVASGQAAGYFELYSPEPGVGPVTHKCMTGQEAEVSEVSRATHSGVTTTRFKFALRGAFADYKTPCTIACVTDRADLPPVLVNVLCVRPELKHQLVLAAPGPDAPAQPHDVGPQPRGGTVTVPVAASAGVTLPPDLELVNPPPGVSIEWRDGDSRICTIKLSVGSHLAAGPQGTDVELRSPASPASKYKVRITYFVRPS